MRGLDKGANEMQDTVLVPKEVLQGSRTGGDLPRLLFMTEEGESHSGRVMVSGRAEGQSWHQASRSSLQASEPGPRTRNQVLNPGLCMTCPR